MSGTAGLGGAGAADSRMPTTASAYCCSAPVIRAYAGVFLNFFSDSCDVICFDIDGGSGATEGADGAAVGGGMEDAHGARVGPSISQFCGPRNAISRGRSAPNAIYCGASQGVFEIARGDTDEVGWLVVGPRAPGKFSGL